MNRLVNDTLILAKESVGIQYFEFELPTRITKLEPVFLLSFQIDEMNNYKTVKVALNPKLSERASNMVTEKQFGFNSNGLYHFDNEDFNGYYIDGEMEIVCSENSSNEKSCRVSIAYGNKEDSLHFIKGKFKLARINN